jgi:ribosomal-protein-alanine N-acetyltransferase
LPSAHLDASKLSGVALNAMVELRAYRTSDVTRLVELASNRNVSRYLVYTFPYPYTTQDAEWWINVGSVENGSITRAIDYEGCFVGSVGVKPRGGWRDHSAEIGYWVGEPYWGRGIATRALCEMTRIASVELGFHRLVAPVLSPNIASMKVLEKCGYELEGILRSEVHKDGAFYDIHHYAKNWI